MFYASQSVMRRLYYKLPIAGFVKAKLLLLGVFGASCWFHERVGKIETTNL